MIYLLLVLLLLVNLIWLAAVVFSLPGNWLMIITTVLFAWWQWDRGVFSIYTLMAITALAVVGEILEFLGGMGGARKAGASWRGSIGAIIGAVVGAILGTLLIPVPVVGTLLGACVGAGLGTCLLEMQAGRDIERSVKSGFGAGMGVFIGTTAKFAAGVVIWLTIAVAAFWP